MARKTLYKKLSERKDWQDIIKRIIVVPNPVKYVQNSFNVGYLTAKKFIKEMNTNASGLASINVKDACELQVDAFLTNFESYVDDSTHVDSILRMKKELENLSVATLKCFFKRLYKTDQSLVNNKTTLVYGVAYLLQDKVYERVYRRKQPQDVKKLTQDNIRRCINAPTVNE